MEDLRSLLFKPLQDFGNNQLFTDQNHVVLTFISTKGTAYFNRPELLSSLKSYVAQVLSASSYREVKTDFLKALKIILEQKLADYNKLQVEGLYYRIAFTISEKNCQKLKESKRPSGDFEDLLEDMRKGKYIATFTQRPILIEPEPSERQQMLIDELLNSLLQYTTIGSMEEKKYQRYRINLPAEALAVRYWTALRKLLKTRLKETCDNHVGFKKKLLSLNTGIEQSIINNNYERCANLFIELLNRHEIIRVYFSDYLPHISIPHIIIHPDRTDASLYAILKYESNEDFEVSKLSREVASKYRVGYWDKLKAFKNYDITNKRWSVESYFHFIDNIYEGRPKNGVNYSENGSDLPPPSFSENVITEPEVLSAT